MSFLRLGPLARGRALLSQTRLMRTAARAAAAMQSCTADRTGKSHSAFARRLRRQSRGASGGRDSTVSPRAAHDNTAALLHSTSCGQIELRICTVPAEALTPLSRFPFRAQTGHEARAIPVGRPCQDGGLGNENFDPDLARRPYSHARNSAPEGKAGRNQDRFRARSTGKGSSTSGDVEGLTAAGRCLRTRWVRFAGCLLLTRDTVYQILVQ